MPIGGQAGIFPNPTNVELREDGTLELEEDGSWEQRDGP
jgi:hypothetical protein